MVKKPGEPTPAKYVTRSRQTGDDELMRRLKKAPNGPDHLVIDASADAAVRGSLARVRADGSIVWRAMPPNGTGDRWLQARFDGEGVIARSWSCYRVTLDADTGAELTRTFTK